MKKVTFLLCLLFLSTLSFSQGHETFDNTLPHAPVNSYKDSSFVGQDGSIWSYLQCRTDTTEGAVHQGNKALMLGRNRSAMLQSGTLNYGIETLEFDYMQSFASNVNLEVYVDNNLVYTATSSSEQYVIKNTGVIDITPLNITGSFTLRFVNPQNAGQVNIDNIIWTPSSQNCIPPSNIAINNIDNESAVVTWDAGYNETDWVIVVGPAGFDINAFQQNPLDPAFADVIFDNVSNTSYNLNNLYDLTAYDVYVMSQCDIVLFSDLIGPASFTTLETCTVPTNISADNITANSVTINWTAGNESDWVIIVGPHGFDVQDYLINGNPNVNEFNTSNNPYTVTSLAPETEYDVYVLAKCDDNYFSAVSTVTTFTSDQETCFVPTGVSTSNITEDEATVSWTAGGNETEWVVIVGPSSFDLQDYLANGNPNVVENTTSNNPFTVGALTEGTAYDVYVIAKCDNSNYSNPSNVVTFTTAEDAICAAPTNILVSGIGVNTATVTWTAGDSETSWEVVYGPAGFDIQDYLINGNPNVNSLTANNATINLSGLSANTGYDVYVFAVCGNDNSDVAAPINFKTDEESSVATYAFDNFKIYPNPVVNELNLSASSPIETVTIYNVLGEEILTLQANSLNAKINIESFKKGVYLIKISINSNQQTFKVVKN